MFKGDSETYLLIAFNHLFKKWWGVQFADADRQVKYGRYNLCRSFGASISYLLIEDAQESKNTRHKTDSGFD